MSIELENSKNKDKDLLVLNEKKNENSTSSQNKENLENQKEEKTPEEEEEEREKREEEELQEKLSAKRNLMFEQRSISIIKLYCHLSYKCEIILMILGTIGSLGGGIAGPIMAWLFGDLIRDFSSTQNTNFDTSSMTDEELQAQMEQFLDVFMKNIDKMVKKLLFIGVGMFVAYFLANFMWQYVGLRQMDHLKEKYFATILKQEQGWFDENNAFEFATKV